MEESELEEWGWSQVGLKSHGYVKSYKKNSIIQPDQGDTRAKRNICYALSE